MPSVFIGMPVYNGARHLREAIDGVLKQDYDHWTLLISDNNSDDDTAAIASDYAKRDKRIRFIRQIKNLGAADNFKYLLNQANTDYFIWLAADDIWLPNFLSTCMNAFHNTPNLGLSFTGIDAIDADSNMVRTCPALPLLTGNLGIRTVMRYVFEQEIAGKANLIYGVLKTDIAKIAWIRTFNCKLFWGQDMCFVLAIACRSGISVDRNICFRKRYSQPIYPKELFQTFNYSRNPYIPFKNFYSYMKGTLNATSGTVYFWPTLIAMSIRLIFNTINGISG